MLRKLLGICAAVALAAGISAAQAEETVKVGVIVPFSGQFADPGIQLDNGIKLYMQENGDTVAGKKIEVIRKDVGGIAPDVAKRLAQELIVRDEVDILAGFLLSPNAFAVGDVSAEAEKFMVVMNAATSTITTKSPYMARTSVTTPQINQAFGEWVANNAAKRVYTLAADYAPGHDAEQAFHRGFQDAGGELLGADRVPVANPDFSAFVQRAKNSDPEGIYAWIPGGAQPAALGKALASAGITPDDTKILGQGELTTDEALTSMGDFAIGIITALHYDYNHQSEKNRAFVSAYNEAYGRNPDIYTVGGYDGMHLIYQALEATGGDAGAEALIEAAKGMSWESPRGPISIDPETRDIVQTVYVRRVEKVDGKLVNVEFDQIENVKDPVKQGMRKE